MEEKIRLILEEAIGDSLDLDNTTKKLLALFYVSNSFCGGCKKPLHDGLCGSCCADLASGNY